MNNKQKQNLPTKKDGSETPTLKLKDTAWKYLDRFYNQFQSKYEVTGDCVTADSVDYLFRRFWSDGTCALYRIKNTDKLGIAQFSASTWNIWDKPDQLQLISRRDAPSTVIPTKVLINGKDCVIAKIRPDGKPIYPLARYYAEELSDIDKAIECNLLAIRNPWIILATPENRKRLADYLTRYLNDEISLSINPDDINSLQILQTNANYIIDKLEVEKTQTLHEALDELGFDNCGQIGDRAVVAEVSLNNAQTQGINDLYNQCAKQIEMDVKDTLNLEIKFTPRMRDFPILSNKINQTIEGKAETDIKEASNVN